MTKEKLEKKPRKNHWYEMYELECLKTKHLEKENAELKTKVTALENANRAMVKELDDTTNGGLNILQNVVKNKEELTKAKEILKSLYFIIESRIDYKNNIEIADEMWRAEQFLKDSEVEK